MGAALAPDLDGLGIVAEVLTARWDEPLAWFTEYHHVLLHNLPACLALAAAAGLHCRRWRAAGLALATSHLHLLGDLVGSRGPDGSIWTVPYLPGLWEWSWQGQWALNAWPNLLLTVLGLAVAFELARRRGYGPVGLVSRRADRAFVAAVRQRLGERGRR